MNPPSGAAYGPGRDKARRLHDLIELTGEMLARAREEDWNQLAALEQQRREGLRAVFDGIDVRSELSGLADTMRRLVELDAEVLECVHVARERCATELRDVKRGRRAQNAYAGSIP